jgi:hypothetical protein
VNLALRPRIIGKPTHHPARVSTAHHETRCHRRQRPLRNGRHPAETLDPVTTPFGKPSDHYLTGRIANRDIVFLPRHGRGHKILPSELNHRANIYGMKQLGVSHIISVSAVGSLKEQYKPTDIVAIDQFIDRTKRSATSPFSGRHRRPHRLCRPGLQPPAPHPRRLRPTLRRHRPRRRHLREHGRPGVLHPRRITSSTAP